MVDWSKVNADVGKRKALTAGGPQDYFMGFVKSSMESVPEMVGVEPSLETEQWRAENPISGIASELLPAALTYGGWYKASTMIPRAAKALQGISVGGKTPVLSGAVREMARYAPLELGKIGTSAVVAPENTDQVAEGAVVNELMAGAAGGVGGLLHAGGPRIPPIPEISSEVNLRDALPLQLRQLKAARTSNSVSSPEAADYHINALAKGVYAERPAGQHVAQLEGAAKPPGQLNRLFAGGTAKSMDRRRFVPQSWDAQELEEVLKDTGLKGNEELIQFPRFARALNGKGAGEIGDAITTNLQSIGSDTWMGKEADDGLYVIARRRKRGPTELTPGVQEATDPMYLKRKAVKPDLARGAGEVEEGLLAKLPVEHNPELDRGIMELPEPYKVRNAKAKLDRGVLEAGDKVLKGEGQNPQNFAAGDEWVLFKTDQPERFNPLGTEWMDKLTKTGAWHTVDYSAPTGTTLNNVMQKTKDLVGFRNFKDAKGAGDSWLRSAAKRVGLGPLQGNAGMAAQQAYKFIKEYAAPSTWQFSDSPRASYVFNVAKAVFDSGKSIANTIMYGEQQLDNKYSLLKNIIGGVGGTQKYKGKPSVSAAIEALYEQPKDVFDVWRAQQGQWDEAAIKTAVIRGEISPRASDFLDLLNGVDKEQFEELVRTQKAFGLRESKALPGHRMISHTFRGSIRIPVIDEKGNLVAMASGHNRAEAREEAEFLLRGAKEEGRAWTKGYKDQEYFTSDYSTDVHSLLEGSTQYSLRGNQDDLSLARAMRERYFRTRRPPSTLKNRGNNGAGISGYTGEALPWKKEDLKDIIFSHLNKYQSYMAELNLKNGMQGQVARLAGENPRLATQLQERIDNMAGRPSAFSKMQNQLVDKVLAPYLGKDSASKLVAGFNKFTHHFQLGMGNISFPILNGLTFMQTVVPHVAFLAKAPKEDIAKYYGWALAMGSDGMPRRPLGVLDTFKLTRQSFRELGKPNPELVDMMSRGIRDAVLDPKIVEEFAGENSSTVRRMKDAMQSPGGVVKWMEAVSNFMPAASERFSRSHAFTTGYILGRDFFGLKGDSLYSMAKTFTDRTMFGYGVVDRAKVLSGPLGNLTGLYKNWQMHYMGWLMEYMNQATKGNMAPLAWMMGGTTALGGVAASPGYFAADGLSRVFANKSLMSVIYDNFGDASKGSTDGSDAVYYGLPSFAGISLQGSAAAPGANPVRDAAMLFSLVQWDRAKALGKAVGSAVDYFGETGEHPVKSRAVRDAMIQAFAPRSMARMAQAAEDGVIRSMNTGNSLARATPAERVLFSLGLTPTDVAKQMDVSNELYNNQQEMRKQVGIYGEAWHQATERRDWKELQKIMLRSMAHGVPLDSILRSATAREAKSSEDALERRFRQEEIEKMTSIIGRR